MEIAVLDDDEYYGNLIESYLHQFSEQEKIELTVFRFQDPIVFMESYKGQYNLLLLDIEMPQVNGVELAKLIRKKDEDVSIIFITNIAQYAINGYEVGAIDYLLKPILYPDFSLKLKRALLRVRKDTKQKLLLKLPSGMVFVKIRDILYVEVREHYLFYHLKDQVIRIRGTMKEIELRLTKNGFFRCNYCYLVNMKHITRVEDDVIYIENEQLIISKNRKAKFLEVFACYLGGI